MAIDLTWRNIGALLALASGFLLLFFGGTATIVEWRLDAVQLRLVDRMTLYQREMDQVEQRLERLEQRQQQH